MPHPLLMQAWVELRRIANDEPGMIKTLATTTVPRGWLECDGRALNSTEYPALAAIIGPAAGNPYGDGTDPTTIDGGNPGKDFNLPDLRGRFVRGWNHGATGTETDGDASQRGLGGLFNGTGVTGQATGDNIGSIQGDAPESHTHTGEGTTAAGGDGTPGGGVYGAGPDVTSQTIETIGATGDTRPTNISLMYVIRI